MIKSLFIKRPKNSKKVIFHFKILYKNRFVPGLMRICTWLIFNYFQKKIFFFNFPLSWKVESFKFKNFHFPRKRKFFFLFSHLFEFHHMT